MKYAIVKIKGQQYKVSEGDEILVDKLGTDKRKFLRQRKKERNYMFKHLKLNQDIEEK